MPEARKIRENLTKEEKEQLEKFGSLNFKSIAGPTCGWEEKFIPRRDQH